MGRNWLRIGRSDDPQVGVIARAEEIERLRKSVTAIAQRVDEVARALNETRTRLEDVEQRRATAQGEFNRRQELYADAKTELESSRARLEQLKSRASTLNRSIEALENEQGSLASALAESRRRLGLAAEHREELVAEKQRLEKDRDEHQAVVLEARRNAEQDRERVQEMALKVESRRSSKESATAALERVRVQQQHLLRRQTELEGQIDIAVAPIEDQERTLVTKLDERLEVEQELAASRTSVEEVDTHLRDAEARRIEHQTKVAEARESADNARLAVREAQVRSETVNEQFQQTGFEFASVLESLPEGAGLDEWSESLEKIGKRINRLGAINLAAIDEYEEQSERKQYLDTQFADLTDALETLENAIRKIDRETRTRFKATFDRANQGLGTTFPRLFGGGHAYLELEGEDLLNSGVTVMARPPGKRISTIHLLSGGEKALTAVALVFSIFELNPAPFCLLDEVDAPLDDANVGRFSDIVKEMSDRVQVVIITHNKTTMEAMHQLSGVTMHEPGVSRLVAVDIDAAVQMAAM
jgi:chromosome segregation protein